MESLKKNKILISVFLITLALFLVYKFSGTTISPKDIINPSTITVNDASTTHILTLLHQMQQARIDSELLTSTAWANLIDYSIPPPTDVPGRPELFTGSIQSGISTTSAQQ